MTTEANAVPALPAGVPALPAGAQIAGAVLNPAPVVAPTANDPMLAAVQALTEQLKAGKAAEPGTPEAKPTPTSTDVDAVFDTASIDDPLLKSMAAMMKVAAKGLDANRAFSRAIDSGDIALLDVAYIKEKAGDQADSILAIAEGIVQRVTAVAKETANSVYATAGGEQNWNTYTAAFNTNAPQALREVVATMLNSGISKQIGAAATLVTEYARNSGSVPLNNGTLQTGGAIPTSSQALSKVEFQSGLNALKPNDPQYHEKRDALFQRRAAGKQLNK